MPAKQKPEKLGRRVALLHLNDGEPLHLEYYIMGYPVEQAIVDYTVAKAVEMGFTYSTLTCKDLMKYPEFLSQNSILIESESWSFQSMEHFYENFIRPRLRWLEASKS